MRTAHVATRTAAGLALLAAAAAVAAQNLVVNGGFDQTLDHWQRLGELQYSGWSDLDVDQSPASGSAWIVDDSFEAGTAYEVRRQCVPMLQPGYSYRYEYALLSDTAASTAAGRTTITFWLHGTADCSAGRLLGLGGGTTQPDLWQRGSGVFNMPAGLGSERAMEIVLAMRKEVTGPGEAIGNVDAIALVPEGLFVGDFEHLPKLPWR